MRSVLVVARLGPEIPNNPLMATEMNLWMIFFSIEDGTFQGFEFVLFCLISPLQPRSCKSNPLKASRAVRERVRKPRKKIRNSNKFAVSDQSSDSSLNCWQICMLAAIAAALERAGGRHIFVNCPNVTGVSLKARVSQG